MTGARRILEIGMFTGYSTLAWAEALPKDGRIVTCEINPETTEIAKRYFAESPHGHKIEIKLGPALDSLKLMHGIFDLCFIDADKENYGAYYDRCMELVRPRGLIILDNMLRGGRVLDPQDRPQPSRRRAQQTHPQRSAGGECAVAGAGWNHAGAKVVSASRIVSHQLFCAASNRKISSRSFASGAVHSRRLSRQF